MLFFNEIFSKIIISSIINKSLTYSIVVKSIFYKYLQFIMYTFLLLCFCPLLLGKQESHNMRKGYDKHGGIGKVSKVVYNSNEVNR